jgi:hypothetical protein
MKKIISVFAVVLMMGTMAFAQKGVIKFKKSEHDFGKIEQAKPATFTFEFTNAGTDPIILGNVQASCGCTTPEWTREPVMPGKSGKVTATYNALNGGPFNKTITVPSNAENGSISLQLKGEVIAKPAPEPAKVGGK